MSVRSAADFDLAGYLARERGHAEKALGRTAARVRTELPASVAEAVAHGLLGGGKRLRPVLCATAYRACGGDGDHATVYDLAVSVELVHAYSLMHDDLPCMDDAELRRGRATTHRVHGVESTVRAGAVLIPLAIRQARRGALSLGCGEDVARAVARDLAKAAGAGGMVGGQVLDLLGEGRRLAAEELHRLHRLKTGALLAASLRMGARAADAPARLAAALDAYGRAVGLAFQIADDVLDATASAGELGKNPSDGLLEKSTYVSLYGLEEARRRGEGQVERACAALDAVSLEAPALRALAGYVTERRR
ncbi:MAG TPA: polyprenyl synthetase family protein [Longimicrobiales bacterium]|nr:polyprenyl synthetase family protein [Longimicrobiales bacterium]